MHHTCCQGQLAYDIGRGKPVWEPLLEAVGERLAGTFMWMDASELEAGLRMHAYKHIETRRYVFLTEGGPAFRRAPCGRFVPVRLDYALQSVLCPWWVLAGWDEEDAAAIRDAIQRANQQDHTGLPHYDDR
jgi:hypothetical protein